MTPKLPPPPKGAPTATPKAQAAPPAQQQAPSGDRFAVVAGRLDGPQRVMIYGPGGIGKSTLASLAPNPVFLDIEGGTGELDVPRVEGLNTFADMRACLQSSALEGFQTVVLDTCTKAEEMAVAHTLAHVKNDKGQHVSSLEGYGYGKGFTYAYETFLLLLADLDRQVRAGRNVVLVAHDCIEDVPNPVGDDWIRYAPHLQAPKSGKASIRNRVVQWADHVLFLGYDVVSENGKGKGAGTRTIWPAERPVHLAKSRRIAEPMPFEEGDGAIWSLILGGVQ